MTCLSGFPVGGCGLDFRRCAPGLRRDCPSMTPQPVRWPGVAAVGARAVSPPRSAAPGEPASEEISGPLRGARSTPRFPAGEGSGCRLLSVSSSPWLCLWTRAARRLLAPKLVLGLIAAAAMLLSGAFRYYDVAQLDEDLVAFRFGRSARHSRHDRGFVPGHEWLQRIGPALRQASRAGPVL